MPSLFRHVLYARRRPRNDLGRLASARETPPPMSLTPSLRGRHQRSCFCLGTPARGHLGANQFRHVLNELLDFLHSPDYVADAFWLAGPVVLKALWCAGELDRPFHPISPERSAMPWTKEIPLSPKHLFIQPLRRFHVREPLVYGPSCVKVKLKAWSLR